ncbi:MAG TPA: DinB family protein [Methylomirabilota bacterium]|jgi:hypothetical protein
MALPKPVDALWDELQAVRAEVLSAVEPLSQQQANWKPAERDWSVGEIVHHLTIAEIATGKLTTKLTREAEAAGTAAPFPGDLTELPGLPMSPGGGEAPPVVWPEHGKPIGELIADMKATRDRSRQSIDKLGRIDPRPLVFKHFRFGDLNLAQWWKLQAQHDALHLAQIRDVMRNPGFPRA